MDGWTRNLLDELIRSLTSPYTGELNSSALTEIVKSPSSSQFTRDIRVISAQLQKRLSPADWNELPDLAERRRLELIEDAAKRRSKEEELRKAEVEAERQQMERAAIEEKQRVQAEAERRARKEGLLARLRARFESDFLSSDDSFDTDPEAQLLTRDEYEDLKAGYVYDWAKRELPERFWLDDEQAAAVAATGGNVLVVARAGTGKTRTLVARAAFLQKHCGISPRAILLMAFNKKAAAEMKVRLTAVLGPDIPHVMTFHALAYALAYRGDELLYDDVSADQLGLSRSVQEVIDEHIRSQEHGEQIRELMLAHFREDWERIVEGRFQLSMEEFLEYRRSLRGESLKGDFVKSPGEKVIANTLFEHGVDYRYESNFRWNGINYKPDFTIRTSQSGGVIIEYFGRAGDEDYDEMSEAKRAFWSQRPEWTFLEFQRADFAALDKEGFDDLLLRKLREVGVPSQRRSEEEIWQLVRRRALDRFTEAMKSFVSRCGKQNLQPKELESLVSHHTACSKSEELFLQVAIPIYAAYLQRLRAGGEEDFNRLVWRAVSVVRGGTTRFVRDKGKERGDVAELRFVMIDEFQDFSQMFFELIDAICSVNKDACFFCVGDDWQAINGFAGSDLRFFTSFADYFPESSRRYLRTNYRSAASIIKASNALMHGRGAEARGDRQQEGVVNFCDLATFMPTALERSVHQTDEITPAVLRLAWSFIRQGIEVVLLSRRNGIPWYVERRSKEPPRLERFVAHLQQFIPPEDRRMLSISTAHAYKGLEKSAVLIMDALEGTYPLIHPNWVFLRVFGDSIAQICDEERRLFYVALTRAENSIAILTEKGRHSPFLHDIVRTFPIRSFDWEQVHPVPSLDSPRLEVRVFGSYEVMSRVKDQLKDIGYEYSFRTKQPYWSKVVFAEGFLFETLLNQPWAVAGVDIEVYSESGELLHQRR